MATIQVVRKRSNALDPKRKFLFDYWLALAVAGLIVVGILVVYSTTFDLGMLAKDDSTYYVKRQLIALGLGIVGIVLIMQVDYHAFRHFRCLCWPDTLVVTRFAAGRRPHFWCDPRLL